MFRNTLSWHHPCLLTSVLQCFPLFYFSLFLLLRVFFFSLPFASIVMFFLGIIFCHFSVFFGVSDPNVMGTIETGSLIRFRKGLYHFCSSNGLVSAAVYTNVTDGQKNDVFWRFFGVFQGSDPNIMGIIETGSSIRFRKGLYHFCSSNGLVSVAD